MWAVSATVAARAIIRFGFRRTAVAGAAFIVAGFIIVTGAALAGAPMAMISFGCLVMGAGLGPSSMAQVLAIQHLAPERERGVATSLVPFFRTVGGSLGVGALGGILSAGLSARLGADAATATHALGAAATDPAQAAAVRAALAGSLIPIFVLLLAMSGANLWLTPHFPGLGPPAGTRDDVAVPVEAH
jgi:MFS family permease